MAKETDARIEILEKESQESRAQMAEMMELIRTLVRDKGSASGPNPQNEIAQADQRREEPIYPPGYTPPYAPNVCRRPILSELLCLFSFWASGPFVTSSNLGLEPCLLLIYRVVESFSISYFISYLFRV